MFKTTDATGTAVFESVPINNYIIAVEESKNYLGTQKGLNLISERTIQPSFTVFIELKPQVSSFVEISLVDENRYKLEKAAVTAQMLTIDGMLESDRCLFDLFKTKRGTYSATLLPGDYVINATISGYKEVSEYFCAIKGDCPGEFKVSKRTEEKLIITAKDIIIGAAVQGTLIKVPLL